MSAVSLIALSAARWTQVMVHYQDSTASAPTAFPSRVGPDLAHLMPSRIVCKGKAMIEPANQQMR